MSHTSLDVYLNDHLAGATMGLDLARWLESQDEGGSAGRRLEGLADEIASDKDALEALMTRLGSTANPIKQGVTWLTEKAGRLKFSGTTTGDEDLGTFLALETLSMGIEGKRGLWIALMAIADREPAVGEMDLEGLVTRAEAQREAVEAERRALAAAALTDREG